MGEHAAANESLKLALHEQGGITLFVMSVELPKEGLKVLADDAVEHPVFMRLQTPRPNGGQCTMLNGG